MGQIGGGAERDGAERGGGRKRIELGIWRLISVLVNIKG